MYSRAYVEITNRCNRACSFCAGTTRPGHTMSVEDFAAVARSLQGITDLIYYHLMGEPLTHPRLGELFAIAKDLGFRSAITTNGTLLPTRGQTLIDAGIYKANISVHSFEDGSEEDYVNYIQGCLDFAQAASQAGILVVLRLWNNGCDEGRNERTIGLLRTRFPEPWDVRPRGTRLAPRVFLEHADRFSWPDLAAPDQGSEVFCHGLRDHFGILCDGTVVPCCLDHNGDLPLGNVFHTPLREILDSPRARAIYDGFTHRRVPEELCRRCGYARRFG